MLLYQKKIVGVDAQIKGINCSGFDFTEAFWIYIRDEVFIFLMRHAFQKKISINHSADELYLKFKYINMDNGEKWKIYFDQRQLAFKARESELNDQMEIFFKKQLTIKEITERVIKQYSGSKLTESHFNDDPEFTFGYDDLEICGYWNENENLFFQIERQTRPLDTADEEQLCLTLECDFQIYNEEDREEFVNAGSIYGEEEVIDELKTFWVYNQIKDLIPISFKVSTHYDG